MGAPPRRFGDAVSREAAILGIAAVAAIVALNHEFFYLRGNFTLYRGPLGSYVLTTAVIYLFVRAVLLVAAMFFPRKRPEFILCPECGRALEDASPHGKAEHRRIALTPKPTEREVLSAIMLRKAIDDARRSSKRDLSGLRVEVPKLPGDVENPALTYEEFKRILDDIDTSAARRRGAPDRRPRGPPERPR